MSDWLTAHEPQELLWLLDLPFSGNAGSCPINRWKF